MKKIHVVVFYLICRLSFAGDYSYRYDNVANAGNIFKCYTGAFDDCFVLKLQVGLDDKFYSKQKDLLDKALEIYLTRAMTNRVIECTYARAKKDLPTSPSKFKNQLYEALGPIQINGQLHMPSLAFISMYSGNQESVGIGYVNLFYDTDKPLLSFSIRHYLHIALNGDYLGEDADYCYNIDAEYWAGVIGHEFLHNLGYRHPNGYEGSFIKEYGHCIETNGIEREALRGGVSNSHGPRSKRPIEICGKK